jgi:hypothetical protein
MNDKFELLKEMFHGGTISFKRTVFFIKVGLFESAFENYCLDKKNRRLEIPPKIYQELIDG